MFIEQAYLGRHKGWRYVVGILIILFFWQVIGIVPLLLAIAYEMMKGQMQFADLAGTSMGSLREALHLPPNLFLFILLLTFAFGLLGIYIVVKYLHKQPFRSITTSRKKFDWKRFFLSFGLIAIYITASTLVDYFSHPNDYIVQFQLVPFLILLIMSIVLIPLQAGFEEYLFRGYLMQGIGLATKTRWVPFIITSFLFGILHAANPEVAQLGPMILIYYIGTGVFLGILTLMDEGMELNLGFHIANNLILVLLVTSDWSALQSDSILKNITEPTTVGFDIIFPLVILYPLLLLIYAKVYKWTNWKERLFGRITPPQKTSDKTPIEIS